MILKSACCNNPSYIDRLISVFMRSLQKMVREHLSPQTASGSTEATAGDSPGRVFFLYPQDDFVGHLITAGSVWTLPCTWINMKFC